MAGPEEAMGKNGNIHHTYEEIVMGGVSNHIKAFKLHPLTYQREAILGGVTMVL